MLFLTFQFLSLIIKAGTVCDTDRWLLICPGFLGFSLSDVPIKAKRSALNYSLPITFNKAGELVGKLNKMYKFNVEEAAKCSADVIIQPVS